jgi:HAE1 family hydrophobic/amphiphilic exporter-1
VLIVSLILIFMVTAALFESIRLPFVVLLTVPMALIGVFLLFYQTGASFTREALAYAVIGELTSSTVLVLTVTPALYLLVEQRAARRQDVMRAQLTR